MRRAALSVVMLLALGLPGLARGSGTPLPPQGSPPPGANNFACRPPARHPYPVVLVHGTLANMTVSWNQLAPDLERLGYCVFALDYGNSLTPGSYGRGDIPTSARQLATFVTEVLGATHAKKVSIVGHSQGGMMPRYYVKFLGGAAKVDDLVGLSPSSHGTTNPLAPYVPDCLACQQQVAGSAFLQTLNAGDQTPPPVDYTVIETKDDEVVTPYTSEFLPGPASRVTNVLVQDVCPADVVDHVGMIYNSPALQIVLNALGRPGPADPRFRPDCSDSSADAHFPDSNSVAPAAPKRAVHVHRPAKRTQARLVLAGAPLRRGSSLVFVLRAVGGPVRGVTARLVRGRCVVSARGRSFSVSGRRRVVLRLRGDVDPGWFVLRALGRDASGRRVGLSRRVRL